MGVLLSMLYPLLAILGNMSPNCWFADHTRILTALHQVANLEIARALLPYSQQRSLTVYTNPPQEMCTMFGNKADKRDRLQHMTQIIQASAGMTQAELARQLQVTRATVHKDLVALETRGVLLAEEDSGQLTFFGFRRGSRPNGNK